MSGITNEPRSARGRALVDYVRTSPDPTYAEVDAVRAGEEVDHIDLTLEPQLPQDRAVPILNREPVRLLVPLNDARAPAVLTRREDFPLDLVHTVLNSGTLGRGLCVWEESWADLRRSLTSQALIERIRNWLSRTATGELHQAEQELEPLLEVTANTLVMPLGPPADAWHIHHVNERNGVYTFIVDQEPLEQLPADSVPRLAIHQVTLPVQVHGALRPRPINLEELRSFVDSFDINYATGLGGWLAQEPQLKANGRYALLLVNMPKAREPGADEEAWEVWAFLTSEKLVGLGELLGTTLGEENGNSRPRLVRGALGDLSKVALSGLRVVQRLDRTAARRFAGTPLDRDYAMVAVGAGAIGSHVVANTIRAGLGTWTIVDDDIVLPHNTVRQVQTDKMIGLSKAHMVALAGDQVIAESGCAHFDANLLQLGDQADALAAAIGVADLVIDFSASPAVVGAISDMAGVRRAASMFFSPDGRDLVVLREPRERSLLLDEIEAQYFLQSASDPRLVGHLASAREDMLRYANACQDLTRPLPPWVVQTLCGIAAGRMLKMTIEDDADARAWRLDPSSGAVTTVNLKLHQVNRAIGQDVVVTVTAEVVDQMQDLRIDALPNETGGVLLGSFDAARRRAHVVAALPAPPDSHQAPTHFIRGAKHLKPQVEKLSKASAGVIDYLGEWHSHPDGAEARPSPDDEKVFAHLRSHVGPTGRPYLMMISGQCETWLRAGWASGDGLESVVASHG